MECSSLTNGKFLDRLSDQSVHKYYFASSQIICSSLEWMDNKGIRLRFPSCDALCCPHENLNCVGFRLVLAIRRYKAVTSTVIISERSQCCEIESTNQ